MNCDNDADPDALSIEDARSRIFAALRTFTADERLHVHQARARVLARDVTSPVNVPPFRSSAMDGYAIRYADAGSRLLVANKSLAGHPGPDKLAPQSCQRITTGARVPDDADTVVMQENVKLDGEYLSILKMPKQTAHVRLPGSDSQQGTLLLAANTRLRAGEQALLAAHGIIEVSVLCALKVALFSTGDELTEAGSTLQHGRIYDANRLLLRGLLEDPAIEVIDLGICPDTVEALTDKLQQAADADVVLSSGGVSVGEADCVRPVVEKNGHVELWKIAMKPGRPLTFGFVNGTQPYFGLPGNPVSAALTCLLFVMPALRQLLSQPEQRLPEVTARLTTSLSKSPGRVEYQRGILQLDIDGNGDWCVSTTGVQDSHVLTSLHRANCLIELALESNGAVAGEQVRVIPFVHLAEPPL